MLGYNAYKLQPYNKNFARALEVQTTSGYIVKSHYYDILLKTYYEGRYILVCMCMIYMICLLKACVCCVAFMYACVYDVCTIYLKFMQIVCVCI